MTPIEEILKNITDMGYVTCIQSKIEKSYYKLDDGTIVSAVIDINYIVQNRFASSGHSMNSTENIAVYVPTQNLMPEKYAIVSPEELRSSSNIMIENVKYEVLREDYSTYTLSNDMILSLKTVVGQISKTKFFNQIGQPIYLITPHPITKWEKIT